FAEGVRMDERYGDGGADGAAESTELLAAPPGERMAALLRRLRKRYHDRITGTIELPARPGCYRELPADIPAPLARALCERGIARLYSHQLEAWQAARDGRDVVVVTPTASGKTLCYNLSVLASILEQRGHAASGAANGA